MKTYRFFLVAYRLSRFIPARLGYWLCSLIGGIVYYFVPEVRRSVRDNMQHILPNSTEHQRRGISRKVIRNVYKNYYDLVRLPHLKPEQVVKMVPQIEGREHLETALAAGKGAIILSGHIGNFSLVAQLIAVMGYKVAVVAEDIEPPQMYNFINRLRGHFGLRLIKMGSAQVRTVYRHLRDGGGLALAADRDVGDTGLPVQFFDAITDLPEGPVVLAMRLRVPIVPCFTWRLPNNKSRAIACPPIELQSTGNYEVDLQANLRKVAMLLEEMILHAPDQWVVLQRIWDKDYTGSDEAPSADDGRQTTDDGSSK
ncbi:MAG TPA: lysophospholipid acyltransferase family protein [Chloroflexia bacterium]|nr:lysophospholipid acyltransferase family protein [Chloroflexia bacterium]